jgi:hypothetical protein
MVQIPIFTSQATPQKTAGIATQIPNITDAATLPYRTLSAQGEKIADLGVQFLKEQKATEGAIYKLNQEKELKDFQINEDYKAKVYELTEKFNSDFRNYQLQLDRKTLVKSTINNILPEFNEAKLKAQTNPDTINAQKDFDETVKQIYNNAISKIDDEVVKRIFTMDFNQMYATNNVDVQTSIRGNSIKNAQTVLELDEKRLFHEYLYGSTPNIAYQKLFGENGIYWEAHNDQILSDLPDVHIAKKRAELHTIEAQLFADNQPEKFLELTEQGYWKDKGVSPATLATLTDTAIDNKRSNDIDYLLSFIPLDPNKQVEDHKILYDEARKGNFHGNDEYQSIYNNLDKQGKADFINALSSRWSEIKADINFNRSNAEFEEIKANDQLWVDNYSKIINGEMTIQAIRDLEFEGAYGVKLQESLVDLAVKKANGELAVDGNLQLYNKLFEKVLSGEITSVTQEFNMPGYDKPITLMDLTGENGIGTSQLGTLYSLISNKYDSNIVKQEQRFQEFLLAYQDQILGNPVYQKFNTQSESRYFDFSLIMRLAYNQGLSEGKTADQLLLSTSSDFILKNIADFIPSNETLMNEMMSSVGITTTESTDQPQIKPGQTWEEYKNSEEYKNWKANQ